MKSFINIINERKDHIINKLQNLSPQDKETLITFFKNNPHLESDKRIDWNNKYLHMGDFTEVLDTVSKTKREKAVKQHGIAGLKEGEDYIDIKLKSDVYSAYIPLTWEASQLIASRKIGGCEGKWCTAYQKTNMHWNYHIFTKQELPIYVIGDHEKWAVMVEKDDKTFKIFDAMDTSYNEDGFIPGLSITRDIINHVGSSSLSNIRKNHFVRKFIELAVTTNAIYGYRDDKFAEWTQGEWRDGTWYNGTWRDGEWFKGTWEDGVWLKGLWHDGLWKEGEWRDGEWYAGRWKKGTWKGGNWWMGVWEDGSWNGGEWNDGNWLGGFWNNGVWWDGNWESGFFYKGTWHKGSWRDGSFAGQDFLDGTWFKGNWRGENFSGTWNDGIWYAGTFRKGTWRSGDWFSGVHLDGIWYSGTWHKGVWEGGTWVGGTWIDGEWKGGKWLGGKDKNGKYHGEGDSPDKWKI